MRALSRGLSSVWRWPGDVATAWAVSFALSLPLAFALRSTLMKSIGHSEAGQRLVAGWDGLWFRSFSAQASGLAESFEPGVVGIGAVFKGLDAMVTVGLGNLAPAVLAAAAAYALVWVALSGGLIARYLAPEHPPGLMVAARSQFARLLPLALFAGAAHVFVLVGVFPSVSALVGVMTLDVIDERVVIAWAAAKYGGLWLSLAGIGLVHDYAKVAMVSQRDTTTVRAIAAAVGLIRRRPAAVVGIVLGLFVGFIAVVVAYWAIAPGAGQNNTFKIAVAFAIGQASVAARIGVRCWGHAARVALWKDESRVP